VIGLTIYCRFDTDMSFSRSLTNYFRSMTMLWKALLIPVFLAWEERVPGWARTTEELTLFFFAVHVQLVCSTQLVYAVMTERFARLSPKTNPRVMPSRPWRDCGRIGPELPRRVLNVGD